MVGRVGDGDAMIGLMTTGGRVAVGMIDMIMGVAVGRMDVAAGTTDGSPFVGTAVDLTFKHPVRRRKASQVGKMILMGGNIFFI